tara:strand:+ start:840 stop:1487 length:648 start_codon:yes stop_codon:yes gene_type:complete
MDGQNPENLGGERKLADCEKEVNLFKVAIRNADKDITHARKVLRNEVERSLIKSKIIEGCNYCRPSWKTKKKELDGEQSELGEEQQPPNKRRRGAAGMGGRKKRKTRRKRKKGRRKTRNLPKLRKVDSSMKKYKYKLNGTRRQRRMAINEGIRAEAKKTGKTLKQAAIAKKGRFNILRIYRRFKKVKDCEKITSDMRYIDKKYKLNKTKNICGKK